MIDSTTNPAPNESQAPAPAPCPLCKKAPEPIHAIGQSINEVPNMVRCMNPKCLIVSRPFYIENWNDAPRPSPAGDKGQLTPGLDLEAMAEAVHGAYLETCARLGWGVKPENQVPYSALSEDSKELDRASVRAVLGVLPNRGLDLLEKMDGIIDRCARKGPGGLWPVGEMKEITARLRSLLGNNPSH